MEVPEDASKIDTEADITSKMGNILSNPSENQSEASKNDENPDSFNIKEVMEPESSDVFDETVDKSATTQLSLKENTVEKTKDDDMEQYTRKLSSDDINLIIMGKSEDDDEEKLPKSSTSHIETEDLLKQELSNVKVDHDEDFEVIVKSLESAIGATEEDNDDDTIKNIVRSENVSKINENTDETDKCANLLKENSTIMSGTDTNDEKVNLEIENQNKFNAKSTGNNEKPIIPESEATILAIEKQNSGQTPSEIPEQPSSSNEKMDIVIEPSEDTCGSEDFTLRLEDEDEKIEDLKQVTSSISEEIVTSSTPDLQTVESKNEEENIEENNERYEETLIENDEKENINTSEQTKITSEQENNEHIQSFNLEHEEKISENTNIEKKDSETSFQEINLPSNEILLEKAKSEVDLTKNDEKVEIIYEKLHDKNSEPVSTTGIVYTEKVGTTDSDEKTNTEDKNKHIIEHESDLSEKEDCVSECLESQEITEVKELFICEVFKETSKNTGTKSVPEKTKKVESVENTKELETQEINDLSKTSENAEVSGIEEKVEAQKTREGAEISKMQENKKDSENQEICQSSKTKESMKISDNQESIEAQKTQESVKISEITEISKIQENSKTSELQNTTEKIQTQENIEDKQKSIESSKTVIITEVSVKPVSEEACKTKESVEEIEPHEENIEIRENVECIENLENTQIAEIPTLQETSQTQTLETTKVVTSSGTSEISKITESREIEEITIDSGIIKEIEVKEKDDTTEIQEIPKDTERKEVPESIKEIIKESEIKENIETKEFTAVVNILETEITQDINSKLQDNKKTDLDIFVETLESSKNVNLLGDLEVSNTKKIEEISESPENLKNLDLDVKSSATQEITEPVKQAEKIIGTSSSRVEDITMSRVEQNLELGENDDKVQKIDTTREAMDVTEKTVETLESKETIIFESTEKINISEIKESITNPKLAEYTTEKSVKTTEVIESTENVPKSTKLESDSVKKMLELSENIPEAIETIENIKKAVESSESNVATMELGIVDVPKTLELSESIPEVVESTENIPKAVELSESVTKMLETSENMPKVSETYDLGISEYSGISKKSEFQDYSSPTPQKIRLVRQKPKGRPPIKKSLLTDTKLESTPEIIKENITESVKEPEILETKQNLSQPEEFIKNLEETTEDKNLKSLEDTGDNKPRQKLKLTRNYKTPKTVQNVVKTDEEMKRDENVSEMKIKETKVESKEIESVSKSEITLVPTEEKTEIVSDVRVDVRGSDVVMENKELRNNTNVFDGIKNKDDLETTENTNQTKTITENVGINENINKMISENVYETEIVKESVNVPEPVTVSQPPMIQESIIIAEPPVKVMKKRGRKKKVVPVPIPFDPTPTVMVTRRGGARLSQAVAKPTPEPVKAIKPQKIVKALRTTLPVKRQSIIEKKMKKQKMDETETLTITKTEENKTRESMFYRTDSPKFDQSSNESLLKIVSVCSLAEETKRIEPLTITKPLHVEVDLDPLDERNVPKITITKQRSSPKIRIKPILKPDEVREQKNSPSDTTPRVIIKPIKPDPLKMTITRQSDETHSILKIYKPEEHQEMMIPKLTIKPINDSPHSPRHVVKNLMNVTVKPVVDTETLSPKSPNYPKVTIKPIVKPTETEKNSPLSPRQTMKMKAFESSGITMEPIMASTSKQNETSTVSPLKISVKPFAKIEESLSPKLTIKPITKTCEIVQSEDGTTNPLKLTIKPLKQDDSFNSPKITIKPVVKPEEVVVDEEKPERIILKIQKNNIPSPKERSCKESVDASDKNEKLGKIKLRLTKEAGHAQIIQEQDPRQLKRGLLNVSEMATTLEKRSRIDPASQLGHTSDISINIIDTKPQHILKPVREEITIVKINTIEKQPNPLSSNPQTTMLARALTQNQPESSKLKQTLLQIQEKSEITCTPTSVNRALVHDQSSDSDDVKFIGIIPNELKDPLSLNEESSQDVILISDNSEPPLTEHPFHQFTKTPDSPKMPVTPQSSTPLSMSSTSIQSTPTTPSDVVVPTPKKRGRPRKNPLEPRPEIKGEDGLVTLVTEVGETRPKRTCRAPAGRGSYVTMERKPRGGGRGRGRGRGAAAMAARLGELGMKPGKETRSPRGRKSLKSQFIRTPENNPPHEGMVIEQIHLDDSVDDTSASISLDTTPVDQSKIKEPDIKSFDQIPKVPTPIKETEKTIKEKKGVEVEPVPVFEEETRMSADNNNSRAQTPARQFVVPLTTEGPEESQSSVQSSATTESTKNKKGRLEVIDHDSHVTSVDQIAEYPWGVGGPYMLQEQIAQYLGVKSFKRKYPGLTRRPVEMQERDFIREKGLVSEGLCDMGLTAVPSSEILDIMYTDFQDKYEEYRKYQRDKQSKEISNKQKAISLATSQEKNKIDFKERAIKSAAMWNTNFNKARRDGRRCCVDLQTFTINYPTGTTNTKVPHKEPPGSYPVALVPGQFTDYYKAYTASELNYLPLNTVKYGPLMPNQLCMDSGVSDGSASDSDSTSGSDSDSSDDSMSTADDLPSTKFNTPISSAPGTPKSTSRAN